MRSRNFDGNFLKEGSQARKVGLQVSPEWFQHRSIFPALSPGEEGGNIGGTRVFLIVCGIYTCPLRVKIRHVWSAVRYG